MLIRSLACLLFATLPCPASAVSIKSPPGHKSVAEHAARRPAPQRAAIPESVQPADAEFESEIRQFLLHAMRDAADGVLPPEASLLGPPANDNFANATLIVTAPGDQAPIELQGENVNATKEPGEPNHGGATGGRSAWWKWTAPSNARVSLYSVNSDFDTLLGIYTGAAVNVLTPVQHSPYTQQIPEAFFFDALAGTTYYFAVDGVGAAVGSITVSIVHLAVTTPTITGQPTGTTIALGAEAYVPVGASGTGPLLYQWFLNNSPVFMATSATLHIFRAKATDAGSYHVTVSNPFGSVTSNTITITVPIPAPSGPVITTQPANKTVALGQSASFSVVATGASPLGYQWLFNGGTINGATSATFSVPNVQPANVGSYTVRVSDNTGTVTSSAAELYLVPDATLPVFTTQPASQTVSVGTNVSFSVVVIGALSYQWLHNGSSIPGATGSSLNLNNIQTTNAGSYTVSATNTRGTTVSNAATLTVNPVAVTPPPAPSSGGGGGAPSGWFFAALSVLAALHHLRSHRR